jgi:hypothetical protein
VTLLILLVSGISNAGTIAEPTNKELGITEEEKIMLIEAANTKAIEMGINPERSNFRLSKEKNLFKADFWPKQKKGEMPVMGGNLSLYFDRKGRTVRVEISP